MAASPPGGAGPVRGSTGVVRQPGQERHETGGHPENGGRIEAVIDGFEAAGELVDRPVVDARGATIESVEAAHSPEHVESIRALAEQGGGWIDADTCVSPASYEVALDAAGGAIGAVDMVLAGDAPACFALIRPPGHHATPDRAMGFCLFNNAAIAARHAQAVHGIERVAILDWDVHHGNGTQDVFWQDPSVLFISLHQWPLYPGTGWLDERGSGEGEGSTLNLPMPPGAGDRHWMEAVTEVALPAIEAFRPGLLVVSAGQDGHFQDGLSDQGLTLGGFAGMAGATAALADSLGAGVVAVHEGGYNPSTLPSIDLAILRALDDPSGSSGEPPKEAPGIPEPEQGEWAERLAGMERAAKGS